MSAEGPRTGIEVQLSCSADDMVRTDYVDPDGTPAFNHYAGAASCTCCSKNGCVQARRGALNGRSAATKVPSLSGPVAPAIHSSASATSS